MADETQTPDVAVPSPSQDTSVPVAPVTDLGQKLQDYQQKRFQQQTEQQQLPKQQSPRFDDSANRAIASNLFTKNAPSDPALAGQAFSYNAGPNGANFERYYEHPLYSKLGFSPFRDNEQIYNQQSTGFQDFERMAKQWGGLALVGLKSMLPTTNPFSTDIDLKSSNEIARRTAIGQSTRPGAASALTNFALDTGTIVGMLGEFAGETLALGAATAATAGWDAPITAALFGEKAAQTSKAMAEGMRAINTFRDAEKVVEAQRATGEAGRIARAALDQLNPIGNLTNLYNKAQATTGVSDFLMNFANIKGSAAALWKDASKIKFTTVMARQSGADVYTKIRDDLFQQYSDKYGQDPDVNTSKDIESRALAGSHTATLANIALLYATNGLVFDTALKGILPITPETAAAAAEAGTRIIGGEFDAAGKKTFERVSNYSFKGLQDALNPVTLAKYGLKHVIEGTALGLSMNAMDVATKAATDYYEQPNLDPSVQGHKSYLASMLEGAKSQISSQGLNTFSQGFFMKAALDAPQHLIFNKMIPSIYKGVVTTINEKTKPKPPEFPKAPKPEIPGEPISAKASADYEQAREKYETDLETFKDTYGENPSGWFQKQANDIAAHEQAKAKYKKDTLDAYNAVGSSPAMAINAMDRNFVKQQEGQKQATDAMLTGHKKSAVDIQQEAMFHHIYTLLDAGQEGMLRDHIKDLSQMNDKQLAQAFDKANATPEEMKTMRDGLNSFGDNIDKVKSHYDYYNKNVLNPYNEYPVKGTDEQKTTEKSFHNYIEYAKMMGTFGRFDYDNTLTRMSDIVTDMEKIKPVTRAPFTDFKLLFDTDARKHEIEALKNEIEIDQEATDSESKRQLKQKQDKLSALVDLHNNILDHQDSFTKGQDEVDKTTRDLYTNYKRYIQALAGNYDETILHSNINNTFENLKHFFATKDDHNKAARAINVMADPDYISGFLDRAEKIRNARQSDTEEKTRTYRETALSEFLQRKENNDFMNAVYDEGAYVYPGDVDDYINSKKIPSNFYDTKTHELISPDSDKMKKILSLVDIYNKVKTKPFTSKSSSGKMTDKDIEDIAHKIATAGSQPTFTSFSFTPDYKTKDKTDTRKHEDLAKQYGFDITKPTQVPAHKVLGVVIASEYSTLAEKTLAQRLSTLLGPGDNINFINTATSPGSYDPKTGIVIDTRYSSDNFKGGVTPIETNILHQVLNKVITESLFKDAVFDDGITKLREIINDTSKSNLDFINKVMANPEFAKSTRATGQIRITLQKQLDIAHNSPVLDEAISLLTTKIDRAFQGSTIPGTTKSKAEIQPTKSPITSKTTVEQLPPSLKAELVTAFKAWNDKAPDDINSDVSELSDYEISLSSPFKRWYQGNPIKEDIVAKYNATISPEILEEDQEEESKAEISTIPLPKGAGKAEPTVIAGTTVVEHGEDTATAQEKENGIENTNLVARGREEARKIGEWAKQEGMTAIEASDVERAQQTAHIAAAIAGVLVKTNPHLATWNIGKYDGKPEGTFNEEHWITSNETPEGGENFSSFTNRMQLAYQDALLASPKTLMIAHSKVTRALEALKQTDGVWGDNTTTIFIGEKEVSDKELHPSWEGKIVYMSPGSGKTTYAKSHANVIDGDDIIVDIMRQRPGYDKLTREELLKTQRDPVTDNKIKARLKELAAEGNTVLIGSTKYIDIADKVFTSTNDNLLINNRFKSQEELDKFKKREADSIKRFKKTPQEFTGYAEDELANPLYEGPSKPIFAEAELEKSVQERINTAKDMADIQDITIDIMSKLSSGLETYDYTVFAKMLSIKEAELSRVVNFADIKTGDMLIMKNKQQFGPRGRAVVIKTTASRLEVLPLEGDTRVHWVSKDKVQDYVEYQTTKVLPTVVPEATPDEITLLNESKANTKAQENNPANKAAVEEAKAKPTSNQEAADDLIDETEC